MLKASVPKPNPLNWPRPARACVFLDFDGTLVDIASVPDAIVIPDDLPQLLQVLLARTQRHVTLVSGRAVHEVAMHLPKFSGDIYGGHGAQSRIDGKIRNHCLAGSTRVLWFQTAVRDYVADHPGALAEMKDAGVVLHYRKAPNLADDATAFVQGLVGDDGDMVAHPAKMAMEIKPVDVDKGRVVERLLSTDRTPLFFGDDTTDEAAFAVVNDAGGISVKVGDGDTIATTRVAHPGAVRKVLWDWLHES